VCARTQRLLVLTFGNSVTFSSEFRLYSRLTLVRNPFLPAMLFVLVFVILLFGCAPTTSPVSPDPEPTVELLFSVADQEWIPASAPTVSHVMGRITIATRRNYGGSVEEFSLVMHDTLGTGIHALHADSSACAYFSAGGELDSGNTKDVRLYTGWLEILERSSTKVRGRFEASYGNMQKLGRGEFTVQLVNSHTGLMLP